MRALRGLVHRRWRSRSVWLLCPVAPTHTTFHFATTTVRRWFRSDGARPEGPMASGVADEPMPDIVLDGELLGDDEVLATAGTDIQGDGGAGMIGSLDDYDLALEDAVLGHTEDDQATTDAFAEALDTLPTADAPSKVLGFKEHRDVALSLLPESGARVPLTDISPGLDVEDLSERFGSVLEFLRLCDTVIAVDKDRATGRIVVSRRRSATAAPVVELREMRPAEVMTSDALDAPKQSTKKSPRRLEVVCTTKETTSSADAKRLLQELAQAAFGEEGGVLPMLRAGQHLDDSARDEIRRRFGSVTRLVRDHGRHHFDVSWDGLAVAYPKGRMPRAMQEPAEGSPSLTRAARDDDAVEEWNVEIDLEEPPVPVGEEEADDVEVDGRFDAPVASAPRPTVDGDKAFSSTDLHNIVAAPAAPAIPLTIAEIRNISGDKDRELTPEAADRLLELHTKLAAARGWKAPSEMLDLFVAVVPTYFVAIAHLSVTPEVAAAIGANTLYKVFQTYAYYFELRDDNGTHMVRLRAGVEHSKRGTADTLYDHIKGKRLRTVSAVFPVLHRILGPRGSLSEYVKDRRKQLEAQPAKPREPIVRKALRHVIPMDRYISIDDQLLAAVQTEAYRLKSEERSRRLRLAISFRSTTDGVEATAPPAPSADGAHVADAEIEALSQGCITKEITAGSPTDYLTFPPLQSPEADQQQALQAGQWGPPPERAFQVRLRPFWVSPNASGDFAADHSPVDAAAAVHIGKHVRSAGLWTAESKLIERMDAPTKSRLEAVFAANAGIVNAIESDAEADVAMPLHPTSLLPFLQLHGGSFWVDAAQQKVRRYAAFVDLDDVQHALVDQLRDALTRLQTDHQRPGGEYSLAEIRDVLPPSFAAMLEPSAVTSARASDAAHAPLVNVAAGVEAPQVVEAANDVRLSTVHGSNGFTRQISIAHRVPAARILRFLKDHRKYFDVRIDVQTIPASSGKDEDAIIVETTYVAKADLFRRQQQVAGASGGPLSPLPPPTVTSGKKKVKSTMEAEAAAAAAATSRTAILAAAAAASQPTNKTAAGASSSSKVATPAPKGSWNVQQASVSSWSSMLSRKK